MDAADPREQRIAEVLGDRYELLDLLDRGGFASVYRVRNLRLHRVEALKVLSDLLTEDADFSRRFEQEARVAAALDHPHIVKIYDYGTTGGFCWFSMQYIDGPSLAREIKTAGRVDPSRAARIGAAVLDALAYSHARGIVHRDIKPDNVLLDSRSRPYLTDFGVAKTESALVKTHAGTLLGSPAYMSPEQLQGKPLDGRSDLYSIGVTLYKALAGELPFSGEDTMRATLRRITEPAAPLSAKYPDLHPKLADIVMRALEREPARRFQSADQMREALEDFLAEVTPPRVPMPAPVDAEETVSTLVLKPEPASAPATVVEEPPRGLGTEPPSHTIPSQVRRRSTYGWVAAAIAVVAVAGLLVIRSSGTRPGGSIPAPEPTRGVIAAIPSIAPPSVAAPAPPTALPTAEPTVEVRPTAPETAPTFAPPPRRLAARRRRPPVFQPTAAAPSPITAPTAEPVPTAAPRFAYVPPKLESQAPLLISTAARAAHGNKVVGLSVTVGKDGTVKDARIVSETPGCPECDRAALSAVRRFRFTPARDTSGNPVDATIAVSIRIPPL